MLSLALPDGTVVLVGRHSWLGRSIAVAHHLNKGSRGVRRHACCTSVLHQPSTAHKPSLGSCLYDSRVSGRVRDRRRAYLA
jgi:hypothetical protein